MTVLLLRCATGIRATVSPNHSFPFPTTIGSLRDGIYIVWCKMMKMVFQINT